MLNRVKHWIERPVGPVLAAALWTWLVGGGILMFYAAAQHLSAWIPISLGLVWLAIAGKLAEDADQRLRR